MEPPERQRRRGGGVKLRIAIEVPDLGPSAETATAVHALTRFVNGVMMLGMVPAGPTPLLGPDGVRVGRAWIEAAPEPAEAR